MLAACRRGLPPCALPALARALPGRRAPACPCPAPAAALRRGPPAPACRSMASAAACPAQQDRGMLNLLGSKTAPEPRCMITRCLALRQITRTPAGHGQMKAAAKPICQPATDHWPADEVAAHSWYAMSCRSGTASSFKAVPWRLTCIMPIACGPPYGLGMGPGPFMAPGKYPMFWGPAGTASNMSVCSITQQGVVG